MSSVTPRAVPFYCPFCGEQEIRPAEPRGYRCQVCDRHWELSLVDVGPGASGGSRAPEASGESDVAGRVGRRER